jgi:sialic acid synthase SpsE
MEPGFATKIELGKRTVRKEGGSSFVIAEAGVNHGGDLSKAMELADIAAEAGADAVKYQAFDPDELILKEVGKAPYQSRETGGEEGQYEMLKGLRLDPELYPQLKEHVESLGLLFLMTPFDDSSLEALEALDVQAYKVASTDLTNLPFLERIARKGKPLLLSTGMSHSEEVELAMEKVGRVQDQVVLMHCTADYPANDEDLNLRVLESFRERFGAILGYSDHSEGTGAAPYAVPLGAKVLEKHFTYDREAEGPDHKASLDPEGLKAFVTEIRRVDRFLGHPVKHPTLKEAKNRKVLQKGLVAARKIEKGERFEADSITAKRTGGEGISPIYYYQLLGKRAGRTYQPDQIIDE